MKQKTQRNWLSFAKSLRRTQVNKIKLFHWQSGGFILCYKRLEKGIMRDKIWLRKQSVIETINDQLKNTARAEHSRYRSFGDFITNLVASLIAYSFQEKKPSIKFETENTTQLAHFC